MSSAFPNEPTGLTTTHDCSFNQTLPPGVLDVYSSAVYVSDGTAPLSGPYVMDVALAAGAASGGVQLNGTFTGRPREVFAGFWIKTNADFEGLYLSTNKVLFIRGGDNSFLVWQGLPNAPKTLKWYQQGTVNNTHVPGVFGTNYPTDGTGWFEPNINGSVATFSAGSGWHKVEIRLRASTTGTSRDGIIQIWVDGTLSTSHFNVNIAPGGFEEWVITPTWDGSQAMTCAFRDCAKTWHWYWDHLYVSASVASSGGVPVLSSLTPAAVTMSPGNTQIFSATMSGAVTSNTTLTLASSSPAVATVGASAVVSPGNASTNFTVTGVAAGSTTISASLSGVTKTSAVTVSSGSGGGGGTPTTYTYTSQFSGVQGQNSWSYRDTNGDLLTYNTGASKWEGSELYLAVWDSGFMHGYPSYATRGAVVRWTAPAAGTVAISGTALLYTSPAGATFTIKCNSTTLFTQAMSVSTSYPYAITGQTVASGDTIDFILTRDTIGTNNNTQLNPVIVFTPTTTGSGSVTVSSMTPSHGNIGSSVTIVGTGFSSTAVNNTVTVNGVPATVTSANTTQLVFTVPVGATTGLVNIATSAGSGTAGTYTVDDPVTPDTPPASNFGGSATLLLVMP